MMGEALQSARQLMLTGVAWLRALYPGHSPIHAALADQPEAARPGGRDHRRPRNPGLGRRGCAVRRPALLVQTRL